MKIIESARHSDLKGDAVNAFLEYRKAISRGEAEFDDYINASVIAFLFQDFGYSSSHRVPEALVDSSWLEMQTLLDEAEKKFGGQSELNFWRIYYRLILEGQSNFESECDFYLSQLDLPKECNTEKQRYVKSILESNAK